MSKDKLIPKSNNPNVQKARFHLTGSSNSPIYHRTIQTLSNYNQIVLLPLHSHLFPEVVEEVLEEKKVIFYLVFFIFAAKMEISAVKKVRGRWKEQLALHREC